MKIILLFIITLLILSSLGEEVKQFTAEDAAKLTMRAKELQKDEEAKRIVNEEILPEIRKLAERGRTNYEYELNHNNNNDAISVILKNLKFRVYHEERARNYMTLQNPPPGLVKYYVFDIVWNNE